MKANAFAFHCISPKKIANKKLLPKKQQQTMKQYPTYKPSAVEWLGEVPTHWEVWKVSRLFKKIGSGTTPKAGTPLYYENGTIPWINTGDLNNGYISDCASYITQKAFDDHSTLKIYEKGTLLVAMYGATIGKIAITQFEACTNQACCSLVSSKLIDTKFAFYWFIAHKENIINLSYGGGQPNISQDVVRSLKIPICGKEEQTAIVAFLDYKTQQIDSFIANRQKQIDLLKEQKAGIINKAVTKGIHPNTKMKDSGIEWLGEVPTHWDVISLKYLVKVKITDGPHETPNAVDVGIPFVSAEAVQNHTINFESKWGDISLEDHLKYSKKCKPINGDIFIVKSGATTGKVAYVNTNIDFNIWSPLALVRANTKLVHSRYLFNFIISPLFQEQVQFSWSFGTQQNIGMGVIQNLKIIIPPLTEQTTITDFIKSETTVIDTLISKYESQISLMQEYRTALISQAVTGKIDVREWNNTSK